MRSLLKVMMRFQPLQKTLCENKKLRNKEKEIAMKKLLLTVLALAMLAGAVLVPMSAAAATKEDVLNEFKKSPVAHYIYDDIVQLANNHPLTSEQYDKILELVKKFNAIFEKDLGPTFHDYDPVAQDKMLRILEEACDYLELHYDIVPSKNPVHEHDDVILIYDKNNVLIFRYDGDEVKKTDTVPTNYTLYALIIAAIMLAGISAFIVVSKKNKANKLSA